MKSYIFSFGFAAIVFSLPIAAEPPTNSGLAARLVEASKVDKAIIYAAAGGMRGSDVRDPGYLEFRACMLDVDTRALKNAYQEATLKALSKSEMVAALAFFESETGRKFTLREAEILKAAGSPELLGSVPKLSETDVKHVHDFAKTRVGRKVMKAEYLHTDGISQYVQEFLNRSIQKCGSDSH